MRPFAEQIAELPVIFDEPRSERFIADLLLAAAKADPDSRLGDLLETYPRARLLLAGVGAASPFLAAQALRHAGLIAPLLSGNADDLFDQLLLDLPDPAIHMLSKDAVIRGLRHTRSRVALLVGLADVAGVWGVDHVTQRLSDAADRLLGHAVRHGFARAASEQSVRPANPDAPENDSGFMVIAMGKYGARELNFSSDIDLIVFYDRARLNLAPGIEPGPFFVRFTRDLVRLLSEHTADGYVFRTDLRLRPDPGSTQIALSSEAAFHYYESFGQNWERAAFIKARAVAGDIAAGQAFLRDLAPFIWRKYLDFAAIADVHAMKRQIHAVRGHAAVAVHGHNLKLGRGGIREIEFFSQTQQLIAGGRQPDLRCSRTLDALAALCARGWISPAAERDMAAAYRFLRRTEHRIQMINDEQTHALPSDEKGLVRVANFCGYPDSAQFAQALKAHLTRVESHYAALFESVPELTAASAAGNLVFTGDSDDPNTLETLQRMGYANPSAAIAIVRGWHFGRYRAMRSARMRESLTEFQPALLEVLAQTAQPDLALASFDQFLAELPSGIQLFAMLRNNPGLLRLIADIMGSAPRLAQVLSRNRRVIDAILDPGFSGVLPDKAQLRAMIGADLAAATDYQDALDRARLLGQEQGFLVGIGLLSGAISTEIAAEAYSRLADGLVDALAHEVARTLSIAHGEMQGGAVGVLALGKLGSEEMTATSDLDLIVVYDHAPDAAFSGGLKPIAPSQYYARFTQRLIAALSAPTARGRLYDVDMRLRPSGNAGPVAVSLASFADYQTNRAWTWEHMALTRARVICAPDELRARIEEILTTVLCRPRDVRSVAADMMDMRGRIERDKGHKGLWDVKLVPGGLLDVEFIAQYLQLVHAHQHPGILVRGTREVLRALGERSLLSADEAGTLIDATQLYHQLTHIVRLCLEGDFDPDIAPEGLKKLVLNAVGEPDMARLSARLSDTQAHVRAIFARIGERAGAVPSWRDGSCAPDA